MKFVFCLASRSTRIKDAGIAICHSQGYIHFYTAGFRNGLKGVDNRVIRVNIQKIKANPSKSKKVFEFESNLEKIRVCTFRMSGELSTDFCRRLPAGAKQVRIGSSLTRDHSTPVATPPNLKIAGWLARNGHHHAASNISNHGGALGKRVVANLLHIPFTDKGRFNSWHPIAQFRE